MNARVQLRGPESRFALAALGLRCPEGDVPGRLLAFLQEEPDVHWAVDGDRWSDWRFAHRPRSLNGPRDPAYATAPWSEERCLPPLLDCPRFSVLQAVARCRDGLCDLWVQFNHVAVDGVPMQELLSRLAAAWGCEAPPLPPAGTRLGPELAVFPCAELLAERRALGQPPLAALLGWKLGQPFSFTVDVPATAERPRTVGLVPLRPRDHATFASFMAEARRLIEATRARTAPTSLALERAAPLPAPFRAALPRLFPGRAARAIGTLGFSIVRGAPVFLAPYNPAFRDGFVALGEIQDGRVCVSVKGPSERVLATLRDVLV